MEEFILLFRFNPTLGLKNKENSWENWIGDLMSSGKFVSMNQLGDQSIRVDKNKEVNKELYFNIEGEFVSGYVIIRSENIDSVTQIAKESPILELNGNIEIRNFIKY